MLDTEAPYAPDASTASQVGNDMIEFIIRLADEGLPIKAIARATRLPYHQVHEILRTALDTARIVGLPQEDWGNGSTRGNRVQTGPQLNDEDQRIAAQQTFGVTPQESVLLLLLLKRDRANREQLRHAVEISRSRTGAEERIDPKHVDVVICKVRKKLLIHGLTIKTLWGSGYTILPADRTRAFEMMEHREQF